MTPSIRSKRRFFEHRIRAALGWHLLYIVASLLVLMPVLVGLSISMQPRDQIFTYPPSLFPKTLYLANYADAWRLVNMGRLLANSLWASLIVMLGKLLLGITSGYAFSHFEFKGKRFLFFAVLFTLMLPLEVRVVPLFELISQLGWANTYTGLVMPFLASATTTFLIMQHFKTIPKELKESADMDGCGPLRFLIRILLPLSGPILAGLATVNFLSMWNTYLWPLMIINADNLKTAQLGIKMLFSPAAEREWGLIMGGTITVVIPTLLIFMLSQRFFVKGIATQGIKE
ncbi:carbohydrate ABC transporter membrane protein 2 (CUT1 family) [Hydrogenispora ethanolica]|uniref:Carbohydrate ABC transporter membrane protein 2 (CUT1 family) n=1 Tax=Hydrogenispora ethanolica TaxID=1082276 RepID=A0A4R1RYL7_HYDET|nr:carbohydrate ABC transporter permease [Hydrogenispora ethanolica]TCL71669.1 carbohydrate ABC transporter membrane protein 2 (CUT1 family) [Hydrogenispora ethanolica]